jgi:hypothetical protein
LIPAKIPKDKPTPAHEQKADLTRDQIAACLDYARELAEFEAVV